MPSTTNHGSFAYNTANIHATIRWYHANAAARAAESVTSDDIGKLSWQYDNDTVWFLKNATPTWVQFGGTASVITADAATELTIASGVVTKTQMNHSIDTESDAASDDLDTISGGSAEDLLFIRANNGARTVVVKHGTGNIVTPDGQDISLDDANKVLILLYDGSNWHAATNFVDTSGFIANPMTTALDASDEDINDIGTMNLASATELTISGGSVTATQSLHTIDTESDAASDDLDTIAGGTDGDILFIRANHTDRTVVVKHGTGNILTYSGQDITLDTTNRTVQLISDGTNWRAVTWMVDTSGYVTTTSSSTLTNKTIDADLNTITNLAHGSEVDNPTSGVHGVTGSVVGTTDTQVIESKTIDCDLNSITNLANASIKSGAAIDAAKIANGSVSNAEFQYLDGVSSAIQTQLNGKLANVVEDTTPQAGGNYDLNGHDLTDAAGGDVDINAASGQGVNVMINDDGIISADVSTITMHKHTEFQETAGFDVEYDNGTQTTNFAIDWENGNKQAVTINNAGPLTVTFTNPPPSVGNYLLKVIQGATPGTLTWPSMKWPDGTTHTLGTSTGDEDLIAIYYDGSGYYAGGALFATP